MTNQLETFPVTAINYYDNLLYLGDELGNLKIWDLSKLMDKVNSYIVESKLKKDADSFITAPEY